MSAVPPDIWLALESDVLEERLRAARRLGEYASTPDIARIRRIRIHEKDALTVRLLRSVEDRLSPQAESPAENSDPIVAADRRARRAIIGLFLHELRPMIGRLELALAGEGSELSDLRARSTLEEMRTFLDAAARLQEAAESPARTDFDLTATIQSAVADVIIDLGSKDEMSRAPEIPVMVARDDHVLVSGDRDFVRLALTNGLRNAVEGCAALDDASGVVVVNWGETDRDVWVSVVDNGEGMPATAGDLFEPAQTTKRGSHLGMGLTIARTAMEGLGGKVLLVPREPRGVRFEIRWPKVVS